MNSNEIFLTNSFAFVARERGNISRLVSFSLLAQSVLVFAKRAIKAAAVNHDHK